MGDAAYRVSVLFSEPKIPQNANFWFADAYIQEFQCSSASRKFLKVIRARPVGRAYTVSVLFSEPKIPQIRRPGAFGAVPRVSVLFSEPKIPQIGENERSGAGDGVSVLFSEPKIPQTAIAMDRQIAPISFSALQRAENSSNFRQHCCRSFERVVSVLFSEPKIPQRFCRDCGWW